MKVEQACRFRMDSGYGISARSPGFDAQQEKALGEVFNDTMNPVFPEIGTSVLSCITRGQYAFWARSTLRTDIHSRTTIFTHSYVLPLREYAAMMEQAPEQLLGASMNLLLNVQGSEDALETAQFPPADCQPLDTQALFEKYRLTPGRYATLLLGAYEAITGNRTLNLFTSLDSEEAEVMVRELTCCILDGMLPFMKKMVTFSSGPDPRMRINVIRSKIGLSGDALVFGVEDDHATGIRSRDPLRSQMFQELCKVSREQRKACLEQIEACLADMINLDNCPSLQLIVTAYFRRCTKLTPDLRLALFRNFGAAAGKSLDLRIANQLLEELLQEMISTGSVGPRELSLVAEWYLGESSEGFRKLAEPLLVDATDDIRVALEGAILKRAPVTPNGHHLLCLLVKKMDPESPKITPEVRGAVMRWIVANNLSDLLFFCDASLRRYDSRQMETLVSDTLKDTHGMEFTQVQMGIMKTALEYLTKNKILMSQEDIDRLDSHIPEYDNDLMYTAVVYLFTVRVPQISNAEKAVELLIKLGKVSPAMKIKLEAFLPNAKQPEVMELYQCKTVLLDDVTLQALPGLCYTYNVFNNPDGPFEQAVYRLWVRGVSQLIHAYSNDVEGAEKITVKYMSESARMRISQGVKNRMKETIVKQFWSTLSIESIIKHEKTVDHDIATVMTYLTHPNTNMRYHLMVACGRIKKNPGDASELVQLLREMTPSHGDYQSVMHYLPWLMEKVVSRHQYLSLDLLMLRCSNGYGEYDMDTLGDILEDLQRKLEKHNRTVPKTSVADSAILSRNSALRQTVIKKLKSGSTGDLPVAQALYQILQRRASVVSRGSVDFSQPPRSQTRPSGSSQMPPVRSAPQQDDRSSGKDKMSIGKLFGGGKPKK